MFEDAAIGTFVVQIEGRSVSSLLYEVTDGNGNDAFIINPSTGVVVSRGALDYEAQKNYNLSITARNMVSVSFFRPNFAGVEFHWIRGDPLSSVCLQAGASARCRVLIHVLDVNDNAPVFQQDAYEGRIVESAATGSLVFGATTANTAAKPLVISARDLDTGANALLSYDIVEAAAAALFTIDSNTGAVRTLAPVDREQQAVVEFSVQVSDGGKPRLQSERLARVRVVVVDVNDSPPVFGETSYNATVLLPTYAGVAVLQVQASDPDTDMNSTLTYNLTGGNQDGKFAVDRKTGWISVANADGLIPYYQLEVSASDGKFTSNAAVHVHLERIHASGLTFSQDKYAGLVEENSTRLVTVAVLNVLGAVLNEHVAFSILNPRGYFQIGKTSGVVQTNRVAFDRETRDTYVLVVEARSERGEGERARVAHTLVQVNVTDINDNRPVFLGLPYYAVVPVDAAKGSVVTKVHALDRDIGENGEIRYELVRGSGELFRVDRRTGEIVLRQPLEGRSTEFDLMVAAYDGGSPPLSAEAVVHIKVIDSSTPVFQSPFYSAGVSEAAEPSAPVLSLQASSPNSRQLIYSIVSGNDAEDFAVDFNTGTLVVAFRR